MAYEKRVCVLKQIKKGFSADGSILTGAVYAERLGGDLTITVKLAGIAPLSLGRYCLAVWADGQIFCLDYQTCIKLSDAPSLAHGFSVLLCFVKGEAEPVAYGGCGEAPREFQTLLSAINRAEHGETSEKKKKRSAPFPLSPNQVPLPSPGAPIAPTVPLPGPMPDETDAREAEEANAEPFRGKYDDEAIAAVDYFGISDGNEDESTAAAGKEKAQETGADAAKDGGMSAFIPPRGSLTYYREVKERLDEVFAKFPRDDRLKTIFPMSEWVNSEGALLGVIYEDGTPRYLCVAVEAKEAPPEEVKERGVFVPRTQFSDEEGFYVVFQDADTGEYVRVYDT